ncbi:Cox family DNA-binding protein [Escherichia coli]|uniref:Cox family DNA-binding protein n=1 Tax=Escherichia coli TaxID=562 RepID=UPI0028830535|nr:Cox family DNA-binding protein [Escherichia coli]
MESNKLPVVHWIKPGSQKGARADSWVYLPAFNAGMQAAFFKKQKEQRDAWLSWLGL